MNCLAIGVVGVGHTGRRHLAKLVSPCAADAALRPAGMYDVVAACPRGAVEGLGVPAFPDLASLLARADALGASGQRALLAHRGSAIRAQQPVEAALDAASRA